MIGNKLFKEEIKSEELFSNRSKNSEEINVDDLSQIYSVSSRDLIDENNKNLKISYNEHNNNSNDKKLNVTGLKSKLKRRKTLKNQTMAGNEMMKVNLEDKNKRISMLNSKAIEMIEKINIKDKPYKEKSNQSTLLLNAFIKSQVQIKIDNNYQKNTLNEVAKEINDDNSNSFLTNKFKFKIMNAMKNNRIDMASDLPLQSSTISYEYELTEYELKQTEQIKYEINNYPDIAFLITQAGNIIHVNNHFKMKLKYTKEIHKLRLKSLINVLDQETYDKELEEFIVKRDINHNGSNYTSQLIKLNICDSLNNFERYYLTFDNVLIEIENEPSKYYNLKLIKVRMMNYEETLYSYIIDPKSPQYLSWTLIMFLTIIYIIWHTTYELGFVSLGLSLSESAFNIYFITFLFGLDMIFNFFLAYEDENGDFVFDHSLIIWNYVTSFFFFDLASTIPFEVFIPQEYSKTLSTQNLKILKIVKFIKLLRLTKVYSFINIKFLYQNEYMLECATFIKRNTGFFELLNVVSFLFIMTHFYSCLYFYIKNEYIESGDQYWLKNYFSYNYNGRAPMEIYFKLYSELLKSALGLGTITPSHNLEIFLDTAWIILGLSLFGYGIGNISAYLNFANKKENEMNESIGTFKDLLLENNCVELENMVINDINKYYENYNINEFNKLSYMLSRNIKNQLETALYKEFIESHPIFEKLDISVIRKLKQCKIKNEKYILRMNEHIQSVYFIIEGSVKILDQNLVVQNEYKQGEIIGIIQFREYYMRKYKVDLFEKLEIEEYQKEFLIKDKIKSKIIQKIEEINNQSNFNLVYSEINIESNYYAISTDLATRYLVVNYDTMEELFKISMHSFRSIIKHSLYAFELITNEELEQSNQTMNEFYENKSIGIMITLDGYIYDINFEATVTLGIANYYHKLKIQDLITIKKGHGIYSSFKNIVNVEEIILGEYVLKLLDNNSFSLRLECIKNSAIARKDGENKPYYLLKKSLTNIIALYFEKV